MSTTSETPIPAWLRAKKLKQEQHNKQFCTDELLIRYLQDNPHLRGIKPGTPIVNAIMKYINQTNLFHEQTTIQTYIFYIRNGITSIPTCKVCNIQIPNLALGANRVQKFCSKTCQGKDQITGNWPPKINISGLDDVQLVNEVQTRPTCKNITKSPEWNERMTKFIQENTVLNPDNLSGQEKIHIIKRELTDNPKCLHCGVAICIIPIHATEVYKYQKFCKECARKTSSYEITIQNMLDRMLITYVKNTRSVLHRKELDIFIPDKKVAIEINGLYWHSENQNSYNKLQDCNDLGIRLIQVFTDEVDDKSKIIFYRLRSILNKVKYKIGARECEVRQITNSKVKANFLNKYHLQGNDKAQINLGLYYKNRLVSVMTFSKPRIVTGMVPEHNTWELSRYAAINSFQILGGASKLLKHFIRQNDPIRVYSYCDLRWSQGDMYKKLGFNLLKVTVPNYWYVLSPNFKKREHRFNFRKSMLKFKLKTFDPNISETKNMAKNGHVRIFDSGNLLFEYQK